MVKGRVHVSQANVWRRTDSDQRVTQVSLSGLSLSLAILRSATRCPQTSSHSQCSKCKHGGRLVTNVTLRLKAPVAAAERGDGSWSSVGV